MRTSVYVFLIAVITIFTSCEDNDAPASTDFITIDGKEYNTLKIGTLTWTTSNYSGSGGIAHDDVNSKPEYGKYYLKTELDAIQLPEGWRIPTENDFIALAASYSITIPSTTNQSDAIKGLISTTNWNHAQGTNTSGFNAYPAGYIFGDADPLDGDIAEFWALNGYTFSIQEAGSNLSALRVTFYDSNNSPDYRFNVRFVKD